MRSWGIAAFARRRGCRIPSSNRSSKITSRAAVERGVDKSGAAVRRRWLGTVCSSVRSLVVRGRSRCSGCRTHDGRMCARPDDQARLLRRGCLDDSSSLERGRNAMFNKWRRTCGSGFTYGSNQGSRCRIVALSQAYMETTRQVCGDATWIVVGVHRPVLWPASAQ